MEFELKEEMINKEDKRLMNIFRKYKDYNTIRRNLREAFNLINFNIQIKNDIKSNKNKAIEKYKDIMFLVQSSFFNVIILYARWFGEHKNNKPKLYKNILFKDETKNLGDTHDYIIELRNKYIAHNEKDLLGGEKVFIKINKFNDLEIETKWKEQILIDEEKLENIRKCIIIVHNAIDKKISQIETLLVNEIKEKNILDELIK